MLDSPVDTLPTGLEDVGVNRILNLILIDVVVDPPTNRNLPILR